MFDDLFAQYGQLVAAADEAFCRMERDYGPNIRCQIHCADCCHAVFGLFLIEAVYLRSQFEKLTAEEQRAVVLRAGRADEQLLQIQRKLEAYTDDPHLQAYALARERVRCPLLNDKDECVLYPVRPITCRVYGIPTVINGTARVCWKAAFERGRSYPVFNLDAVYRALFVLSREMLERSGQKDTDRASILLSVARSLRTPVQDLIAGNIA